MARTRTPNKPTEERALDRLTPKNVAPRTSWFCLEHDRFLTDVQVRTIHPYCPVVSKNIDRIEKGWPVK